MWIWGVHSGCARTRLDERVKSRERGAVRLDVYQGKREDDDDLHHLQ